MLKFKHNDAGFLFEINPWYHTKTKKYFIVYPNSGKIWSELSKPSWKELAINNSHEIVFRIIILLRLIFLVLPWSRVARNF